MMEVRVQLFHSAKLVTICSTAFLLIFVASHLLLSALPFSFSFGVYVFLCLHAHFSGVLQEGEHVCSVSYVK